MNLALVLFFGGCGETTSKGKEVLSPGGSIWRAARVDVRRDPGGPRASEFGVAKSMPGESRWLILEGPGREWSALLQKTGTNTGTREILSFAPDGHALAVSVDGVRHWRYITLDAGDDPLFCDHVTNAAGAEGPWLHAPRTRDLVLEILKTSTGNPAPVGGMSHRAPPMVPPGHDEFGRAAVYAMARSSNDDGLCLAFAHAFLGPDAIDPAYGGIASGLAAFVPDAGKLAGSREDVYRLFEAGLDGPAATGAAMVLGEVPDGRTEVILAKRLQEACRHGDGTDAHRQQALWLVWALARVTVARKGGSEDARIAFALVLGQEGPFVERVPRPNGLQSTALARAEDSAARRFAIKGLAVLSRSSPAARMTLDRVAAGSRRHLNSWTGEIAPGPATGPAFSPEIRDLTGHERFADMDEYYEAGSWARAAVEWLDRGAGR